MSWFVITLAGLSPLYGVQSVTISVLELLPVVDGDWGEEVKELLGMEEVEEQVGLNEGEYIINNVFYFLKIQSISTIIRQVWQDQESQDRGSGVIKIHS
jgi:hypothetical protein